MAMHFFLLHEHVRRRFSFLFAGHAMRLPSMSQSGISEFVFAFCFFFFFGSIGGTFMIIKCILFFVPGHRLTYNHWLDKNENVAFLSVVVVTVAFALAAGAFSFMLWQDARMLRRLRQSSSAVARLATAESTPGGAGSPRSTRRPPWPLSPTSPFWRPPSVPVAVPHGGRYDIRISSAAPVRMQRLVFRLCLASDPRRQQQALSDLRSAIERYDADGEFHMLGHCIREVGALAPLLLLLDRADTEVQAMMLIGNLASHSMDENAHDTKRLLFHFKAFPLVLQRIYSADARLCLYALGAVQNTCASRRDAAHMRATHAEARLRHLEESCSDPNARQLAAGCLDNMATVLAPGFVPDPRLVRPMPTLNASIEAEAAVAQASAEVLLLSLSGAEEAEGEGETEAAMVTSTSPRRSSLTRASGQLLTWARQRLPRRRSRRPGQPEGEGAHEGVQEETAARTAGNAPLVCCVCLEQPIQAALTPCFHASFCSRCAGDVFRRGLKCPMCRSGVQGVQRIYL